MVAKAIISSHSTKASSRALKTYTTNKASKVCIKGSIFPYWVKPWPQPSSSSCTGHITQVWKKEDALRKQRGWNHGRSYFGEYLSQLYGNPHDATNLGNQDKNVIEHWELPRRSRPCQGKDQGNIPSARYERVSERALTQPLALLQWGPPDVYLLGL